MEALVQSYEWEQWEVRTFTKGIRDTKKWLTISLFGIIRNTFLTARFGLQKEITLQKHKERQNLVA
jgi:hypothetical protein